MAAPARFSGQYAAAQLEKLDALLPCHFPLAYEVAGYLGYPPDFVPPTYLAWARAHGRIPSMRCSRDRLDVRMYDRELVGYDGVVEARVVRFYGQCLEVDFVDGAYDEVQEQAGACLPYCYIIQLDMLPEDREFFDRWAATYRDAWP